MTTKDDGTMRGFDTGATRDTGEGKLDFEGFYSPMVMEQFARFMNMNRLQSDGKLRDSDNWQKGIPMDVYMKSGFRHFFEWWTEHRSLQMSRADQIKMVAAICGLLFNAQGYLHELLKEIPIVEFDDDEPTVEMRERQESLKPVYDYDIKCDGLYVNDDESTSIKITTDKDWCGPDCACPSVDDPDYMYQLTVGPTSLPDEPDVCTCSPGDCYCDFDRLPKIQTFSPPRS